MKTPFNQDKSFREQCSVTNHTWALNKNNEIDLEAYQGTKNNRPQLHAGPKCLNCGYYLCKHCDFGKNLIKECDKDVK